MRSASAKPTLLASPWPSGPVVVSMPAAWPYSGWPAVREPTWRKCLIWSSVDVRIAGEIEQRIEQHRAVAGRQDETVAVGPVRVGGIVLQELREQHRGDIRHAHRQAGVAGFGLLDGVHGEEANGIGHPVMLCALVHGRSQMLEVDLCLDGRFSTHSSWHFPVNKSRHLRQPYHCRCSRFRKSTKARSGPGICRRLW